MERVLLDENDRGDARAGAYRASAEPR